MKTDHAVYHQIEPDHVYASLDTGEQVSKESTFMRLSTGIIRITSILACGQGFETWVQFDVFEW